MTEKYLIKEIINERKSKKTLSSMLIKEFPDLSNTASPNIEPHSILKNIKMNVCTSNLMNINTASFNQDACRFINIELNEHTSTANKKSLKVKITPHDETILLDKDLVLKGTISSTGKARGNKIGPAISKRRNDRKKIPSARGFDNKDIAYLEYVNSFIKTYLNKKVKNINAVTLNRLSTTNIHEGLRRDEFDEYSAFIKFEFKSRVYCILFIGSCVICSRLEPSGTGFNTTINLREYFKNDDSVLNDPNAMFTNPDKLEITKLKHQLTSSSTRHDKEVALLKKEIRAKNKEIKRLENENALLLASFPTL